MSEKIAELEVEVGVEGAKEGAKEVATVEKSLQDLKSKGKEYLSQFSLSGVSSFAAVGAAVAGAVAALAAGTKAMFDFVSETSEGYDRIDKLSKKIGLSASEFQKLEFAANRSGAEIDAIGDGLKTLQQMIDTQKKGGAEMVTPFSQTLAEIGLAMDDLENKNPQERLEILADALMDVKDPADKLQKAIYLLGETGAKELTPLFEGGAKGIRALTDEAEKYGLVTDEAVASGAAFADSMLNLETQMKSIKGEIFQALAPAFTEIVTEIKDWIGENDKFISQDLPGMLKTVGMALVELAKFTLWVVDGWRGFIKEIQDKKSLLEHDYPNIFNILAGAINGLIHPIEGAQQIWAGWKGIFENFSEAVGGVLEGPLDRLTSWFEETFPGAADKFGRAFEAMRKPIDKIGEIIEGLFEKVVAFFSKFEELKNLASSLGIIEETRAETRGGAKFLGGGEDLVSPQAAKQKADAKAARDAEEAKVRMDDQGRRDKAEGAAILDKFKVEKRKPSKAEMARLQQLGVDQAVIDAAVGVALAGKPKPAGGGGGATTAVVAPEEKTSDVTIGEAFMAFRTGRGDAAALAANINTLSARAPDKKGVQPTVTIDVYNFDLDFNVSGGSSKEIAAELEKLIQATFKARNAKTAIDLGSAIIA